MCVVSVRPEHLGGDVVLVDGQHTGMMDILGECDHDHDTLELHHSPTASLEEVEEAEATLYKALNTQNKKLSKLDIIRVDLFLNEPYAILFNGILNLCGLNIDGLGDSNGDVVPGAGSRMILTVSEFGDIYHYHVNALWRITIDFKQGHYYIARRLTSSLSVLPRRPRGPLSAKTNSEEMRRH